MDGKAPVWLNSVLGWIDTKGQLSDGFAEDVTESFLKEEKREWQVLGVCLIY